VLTFAFDPATAAFFFPHGLPQDGSGRLGSSVLGRLAVRPCLWGRDHARPQHQIFVLDAFIPVAHLDCSILPLTDQCLAPCRPVPPILRLELQKMPRYCTTQCC